jgi:hypothetical protein
MVEPCQCMEIACLTDSQPASERATVSAEVGIRLRCGSDGRCMPDGQALLELHLCWTPRCDVAASSRRPSASQLSCAPARCSSAHTAGRQVGHRTVRRADEQPRARPLTTLARPTTGLDLRTKFRPALSLTSGTARRAQQRGQASSRSQTSQRCRAIREGGNANASCRPTRPAPSRMPLCALHRVPKPAPRACFRSRSIHQRMPRARLSEWCTRGVGVCLPRQTGGARTVHMPSSRWCSHVSVGPGDATRRLI